MTDYSYSQQRTSDITKLLYLATWYCSKSGRFIGAYQTLQVKELLTCHGFERASTVLQLSQLGKVHPLWLATDAQALSNLVNHDPIGYFIYSASLLLHPSNLQCGESQAPNVGDLPSGSSAAIEQLAESLQSTSEQHRILRDKVIGHAALHTHLQEFNTETLNLLEQLNSTLANLFAIRNPELIQLSLRKMHGFNLAPLAHWTHSLQTLRELLTHLQAYAAKIGQQLANLQRVPMIHRYIAKSTVLEEIGKSHGLASFRGQRKPKVSNLDDEIMTKLRDFLCDCGDIAASPPAPMPPCKPATPVQLASFAACLQSKPATKSLSEILSGSKAAKGSN